MYTFYAYFGIVLFALAAFLIVIDGKRHPILGFVAILWTIFMIVYYGIYRGGF